MPEVLRDQLFPHDNEHAYVIIDGASCEDLLGKLDEFGPRHYCLYAGEIDPDIEEVAPHLVELLEDHPFTDWFLADSQGKPWGVFVRGPEGLRAMRKHFRTLLMVISPEGKKLYFRYYDPRVLRIYLPTCERSELKLMFGPVTRWLCESEDPAEIMSFSLSSEGLDTVRLALNPGVRSA